jgi:ribosomal protein L28
MANRNVDCPITGAGDDRGNSSRSETFGRSRREFLTTVAAFGLTSVAPVGELIALTAASSTKRSLIDVHHHMVPPFYLAENRIHRRTKLTATFPTVQRTLGARVSTDAQESR